MEQEGRDKYIDFLRCVGLVLIVLAHVEPPYTLHQIRTFDVPLMVFVSGLSFSGRRIEPSLPKFYLARIKRIIIPTYLFLFLYFVLLYVINRPISVALVVKSYLLLTEGSIGYVWIIRVFLLLMLVMPLLSYINERFNGWRFYSLVCLLFVLDCFLVGITSGFDRSRGLVVFTETVPYLLGYSVLFMLGLRIPSSGSKETTILLVVISLISLAALSVYLITLGTPIDIQAFKYPPTSFFILYGAFASTLLWSLRRYLSPLSNNSFVLFIGRNTIWIYFWHIIMLIPAYRFFENWGMRYVISLFGAIALYFIQYSVVKYCKNKTQWSGFKYLVG